MREGSQVGISNGFVFEREVTAFAEVYVEVLRLPLSGNLRMTTELGTRFLVRFEFFQETHMAVDIVMPQMGESIFEGTITKWLKKPGDKVERDEPLFEISTDKVDAEIPSPSAGVLKEIKVGEGKTVPIQTVVGVIDAAGDGAGAAKAAAPATAPAKAAPPAAPAKPAVAAPPPPAARSAAPSAASASQPAAAAGTTSVPSKEGQRIHSSPLVRRMAKEHGVDLSAVPGTGAGGRVSKQDIEAYIAAGGSAVETEKEMEPAEADVYTQPVSTSAAAPPPRAVRDATSATAKLRWTSAHVV